MDTSGGIGNWKVNLSNTITSFSGSKYGANITTGDVDGDDIAEIIVGAGSAPKGQSRVKVLKADGTVFSQFTVYETDSGDLEQEGKDGEDEESGYGVNVAASDLDGDGLAEIITGSGPDSGSRATVRVFKATGVPIGIAFDAYSTRYGVNVSVGKILD